jgi:hypothetical protein
VSSEYVKRRLAELGQLPKSPKKKKATTQPRRHPYAWAMRGIRPVAIGSPVITCDCHPNLQASANIYIAHSRRSSPEQATWFDVRNAFYIGYHLALEHWKK